MASCCCCMPFCPANNVKSVQDKMLISDVVQCKRRPGQHVALQHASTYLNIHYEFRIKAPVKYLHLISSPFLHICQSMLAGVLFFFFSVFLQSRRWAEKRKAKEMLQTRKWKRETERRSRQKVNTTLAYFPTVDVCLLYILRHLREKWEKKVNLSVYLMSLKLIAWSKAKTDTNPNMISCFFFLTQIIHAAYWLKWSKRLSIRIIVHLH